jgi:dynein heavy chain, axonemal
MLERAVLLVDGLSSERLRWADVIKGLEVEFLTLPGDSLLSTAFVCYLGPFISQIRDNLMKMWLKQMISFEIPCNSNFVITDFLCDTFTKQEWNTMGLPSDTFSMENAVCITNCSRWPLLIDPQSQSHRWIQNLEEKNKLITLDVGQSDFVTDLEKAIRFGRPVLLQNVMETLDATLMPIINKAFVHQAGHILLKFNNKYIEYNPSFK